MKRFNLILALSFFFIFVSLKDINAQVIIKAKPVRPKVIVGKPDRPNPGHVWVASHWQWNKKQREYVCRYRGCLL